MCFHITNALSGCFRCCDGCHIWNLCLNGGFTKITVIMHTFFACLSSRFVYGETINEEKLGMVEKAEQLLLDLGFYQVRVRIHDKMARIEILPSEFEKLLAEGIREKVYNYFKELGFTYVTLDLGGYRTGSMNETLH